MNQMGNRLNRQICRLISYDLRVTVGTKRSESEKLQSIFIDQLFKAQP